jgi:hypothetical protein
VKEPGQKEEVPGQNAPGQNAPGQNAPGQNAPGQKEEEAVPPAANEKKPRCADGTRRFPAIGPECYTPEQIEEHKRNKTQKLKKK